MLCNYYYTARHLVHVAAASIETNINRKLHTFFASCLLDQLVHAMQLIQLDITRTRRSAAFLSINLFI